MPVSIRATRLRKNFGPLAVVNDVSFEVAAGETLVLLGPSGCGKTTLLKLLNRLLEPDGGTVEINGRDVREQRPEVLRRGLGYVIQQVGLLPHYTVAENIAVVPRLLGHAPAAVAARTAALLARLHLPPARFAALLPAQLSGGQQQRVGLARALAADPPIVLLDEPFGALDPITRASIRREFRELEELKAKTVVLVTHDVTEAFELADRILLLDGGRVQQLGTPRELLFRPANDFVRRFFAVERLALQLRTLTLGDALPGFGINQPGITINQPDVGKIQPGVVVNQPSIAVNKPDILTSQPGVELIKPDAAVSQPSVAVSQPSVAVNKPDILTSQPGVVKNQPDNREDGLLLDAQTTVHDALAALTETSIGSAAAPFTVAELMAAFGEALQREEAAWKR